jgi:adenosine/AMP kinase
MEAHLRDSLTSERTKSSTISASHVLVVIHTRAWRFPINLKAGKKDGNHQAEEFSSAFYVPAKVIIFFSMLFIN